LSAWLGELKDVFYDAMDVLDKFDCEDLRRKVVETHGSTGKKVRRFFSSSNPLAFRYKMGHRIKEIRERLQEIAKVRDQFQLEKRFDDKRTVHRETHSFVPPSYTIGRDDEKEDLIDLLMQPGDDGNVSVIAIVAMGGMGKTTLVQLVYNDERVVENFDSRIWVCMSEDFNVLKLAKEILNPSPADNLTMDQVQAAVRDTLKGKNFVLVLDDVWNEDRSKWIDMKNLLIGGAERSKIIVTTRSENVAFMMSTGPTQHIRGIEVLPKDDCLSLLLRWAFNEGEEKKYPKLREIGMEIVEKCKGVPLVVKTLGSLLYSKSAERDWIFIRDSEIWKLEQEDDQILPALRLSYDHLPWYLKPCFAYCSLYPKGHIYNSIDLTQCWMANGLLQISNRSNQEFEDIGLQYVNELLSRSLIQKVCDAGNFITFKMPDIVHDLSLYVAQSDHCFQDLSFKKFVMQVTLLLLKCLILCMISLYMWHKVITAHLKRITVETFMKELGTCQLWTKICVLVELLQF
jgi:hypothetical protein